MKNSQIALMKTVSWRIVASLDTFIILTVLSGKPAESSALAGFEVVIKLIAYYLHEQGWMKFADNAQHKISFYKSLSWRVIATSITTTLGFFLLDGSLKLLSLGALDVTTKLVIYYGHERLWVYLLERFNESYQSTSK